MLSNFDIIAFLLVSAENRYALIGAVLGILNKDTNLLTKNLRKMNFFPKNITQSLPANQAPQQNELLMVQGLSDAVLNSVDTYGDGTSLNFTKLSSNIQSSSLNLPFQLPTFATLIIRTLTILEGLALSVNPKFRLIKGAYPFILKQILTDPTPEMTELLSSILLTTIEIEHDSNGEFKIFPISFRLFIHLYM